MKDFAHLLLSSAIFAGLSVQHVAIQPPRPDRILTPNSTVAPAGCKLLASDKGWPSDETWLKAFPKAFKKMKGTEGPDWWIQPQTNDEVSAAFKFAKEHNVRLTVATSGHDFHAREDARSGLRVDMAAFMEPTVFTDNWKCGDTLKPKTSTGRTVDSVIACKVPNLTQNLVGRSIRARQERWHFFEKRDGLDCEQLVKRHLEEHNGKLRKRADPPYKFDVTKPWEWAVKTGFKLPPSSEYVPAYNVIKPTPGKQHYARISGGMYNELFFTQADKSDLMTLGAQHGGVGVLGGWMQGGGHNPFAHMFGMQVDNIVELEVVTPDGKFQKVSECSNPELFWALRGGGGGTFGIVTAGTVKVYPTFPIIVTRFMVNSTKEHDPKLLEAVAYFLQNGSKYRDANGLQGYFYVYPKGFHSVLHMPGKFATMENAKNATETLMRKMEEIAGAQHITPQYYQHKRYIDWYVAEMGDEEMEETGQKYLSWYDGASGDFPSAASVEQNPLLVMGHRIELAQKEAMEAAKAAKAAGKPAKRDEGAIRKVMRTQPQGRTYLDSRLLSDAQVNRISQKELGKLIDDAFPRITAAHWRGFLYGGGKMAAVDEDAMSLIPDWRNSTYHFIVNGVPGSMRHDFNIRAFDKVFPEAGAYVNEANPHEPDWKNKFWGRHYAKLEAIKMKVDPQNIMWCSPCVNADYFTFDDERICKNPKYPQSGPPPETYRNDNSKTGIASLPGEPGIPNPLQPLIDQWIANKTVPSVYPKSNYFKMAMGQGGSVGGKWTFGPPAPAAAGNQPSNMGHGHGR